MEKGKLLEPQKDELSTAQEEEITNSSFDSKNELDVEFENLRKATALKDEIVVKIETIVASAVEGNSFLKEHLDSKILIGGIEDTFYLLDNDEDKVNVMESILTMLNSSEKYTVKEIYDNITEKIEDKLGMVEGHKPSEKKEALIRLSIMLGVLLGMLITLEGGTVSLVSAMVLMVLVSSSSFVVKKLSSDIDRKIDKHEFFDMINEYIPDITREDFEQLFENTRKIKLSEHQQGYFQNQLLALLKDYKETDGVVTQKEISELIETTNNL